MSNEGRTVSVGIEYTLDWTNVIQAIWDRHVRHCLTPFGARSARFDAQIDVLVEHRRCWTAPNVKLCRTTSNNVQHLFDVHLVQFSVRSTQFDIRGNIIRHSRRIAPNGRRTASNERWMVSNNVEQSGFYVVKYYTIIFNNIWPNSNNLLPLGPFLGFFYWKINFFHVNFNPENSKKIFFIISIIFLFF